MAGLKIECEFHIVLGDNRIPIKRDALIAFRDELDDVLSNSEGIAEVRTRKESSPDWTPAEDDKLRRLAWDRGWDAPKIVPELPGRTIPAIRSRLRELRKKEVR